MKASPLWLEASSAATQLGVTRATLYAYVSRGLIRSQPMPGSSRAHGYAREDVERLVRRAEARRDPTQAAAHALEWGGMPVLESAITFIDGRSLYYRGHDVVTLARTRSVEDVASLIWLGEFGHRFETARPTRVRPRLLPYWTFISRAQTLLGADSGRSSLDLRPSSVAQRGWQILHLLPDAALGPRVPRAGDTTIDERLSRAWRTGSRGTEIIRAALIFCADHELNVSSFTARCVASAGSPPHAVVIAGLSALEGFRHGGAGARVAAMLDDISEKIDLSRRDHERALKRILVARLQRGELVSGFGHPLYPEGDPRARALLNLLRVHYGQSDEWSYVDSFAKVTGSLVRETPNLDFALAAVERVLQLPAAAPLMLFAIGRTIGWIGQAIEQYATEQLIRPRARYVGPTPVPTSDK